MKPVDFESSSDSGVLQRVRAALCRFHRDRSGTSLTEFVITLPVFVLFFGGILTMWKLQEQTVKAKGVAFSRTWSKTMAVQRSNNPVSERLIPASAAVAAADFHNNTSSGTKKTVNVVMDSVPVGLGGHIGESYSRLGSGSVLTAGTIPPSPKAQTVQDIVGSGGSVQFTERMLDDTITLNKNSINFSGWKQAANSLVTASGARPGIGAGMRYGIIGAHEDRPILLHWINHNQTQVNAQFAYHVTAPPSPTNRILTVLMPYLVFSGNSHWDEPLMAFQLNPQNAPGMSASTQSQIDACQQKADQLRQDMPSSGLGALTSFATGSGQQTVDEIENLQNNECNVSGANTGQATGQFTTGGTLGGQQVGSSSP